jgi:putative zinc finger protein
MTVLTCAAVRQRLAAYHDDELPLQDAVGVQAHVHDCAACATELSAYETIAGAVRLASAPAPADDWTGVQPGVLSRMRAEANEAWAARFSRMFDDMHLVWISLAATAATLVCGTIVLGMLHFASPERDDSLAAIIAVVGAPSGSNKNPASLDDWLIKAPRVPEDGIVRASLERSGSEGELMLALSAVITREGNISGVEVLGDGGRGRQVSQLVNEISRGRLDPARQWDAPLRQWDDPVAVNLVWLVEHMTVKPKQRS